VETFSSFNRFLSQELQELNCNYDTKSYIVSIFDRFRFATHDQSNQSISLLYADAKFSQAFEKFSNIGDWLFMCNTLFPEHLNGASIDYYYAIGQSSYYQCYKLLKRQWKLYEELSDKFPDLTMQARELLTYSM
jgi:hypothetical protein